MLSVPPVFNPCKGFYSRDLHLFGGDGGTWRCGPLAAEHWADSRTACLACARFQACGEQGPVDCCHFQSHPWTGLGQVWCKQRQDTPTMAAWHVLGLTGSARHFRIWTLIAVPSPLPPSKKVLELYPWFPTHFPVNCSLEPCCSCHSCVGAVRLLPCLYLPLSLWKETSEAAWVTGAHVCDMCVCDVCECEWCVCVCMCVQQPHRLSI